MHYWPRVKVMVWVVFHGGINCVKYIRLRYKGNLLIEIYYNVSN